ncbi:low affinity immunoglobulin gamma Fc region receptor II-like isoform X5 [Turdus rufiventris]|nr:low affinity immunoglobulin gamma Fc region receptor II-like isoform X5 [Turdus rufiventris]
MPAVLWDWVTLTCQGSGTTNATTWYKNGRRWGQKGGIKVSVTEVGTYQYETPGTRLSTSVTVSNDWLVLQVPAGVLLEGDTVTLRCRGWRKNSITSVSFYLDGKELGTLQNGTEWSLSPLQLKHSGRYHCKCRVYDGVWKHSAPVAVTVQVPVANATITPGHPALQVHPGDPVTLHCSVQVGSAPVTFTWLHNGHQVARSALLEFGAVHVGHSGTYQCVATNQLGQDGHRVFRALSPELALEGVARGPILEFGAIHVGHSNTYQCVATNQLGQDGHCVFRALSPEMQLEVTPQGTTGHLWSTVLVTGSLLFMILLIVAFCCGHRMGG